MFEALLRLWPQWLAALMVTLLCVAIGLDVGWTSPYLALLTGEEPPFAVTQEQAGWIASLPSLGRLLGAAVGSLAAERHGSKTSLLLTATPLIAGWICVICANCAAWLYVGRLLTGASMGMLFSCYPLYIGEISAPSIRGALASVIINGITLGILLGNAMGRCVPMRPYGIAGLILTLCYTCAFFFLPRSPHYYVQRNNAESAEIAARWYHRGSDVSGELEAVERFVRSSRRPTGARERLKRMREPQNRRAFATIILLFAFMQLSGLNVVVSHMEIIARSAMITSIAPFCVAIIVSATGVIFGWIAACAIDRYGRRVLLAISSAGVMIGMSLLGVHFLLLDYDHDPAELEWLAVLSLKTFALVSLGLVPVPSTMLGELFPCDLRSVAGFVGSATSATFAFAVTGSYRPLVGLAGEQYVFWIYAAIVAVCLGYSLVWVPETKGKTLQTLRTLIIGDINRKYKTYSVGMNVIDDAPRNHAESPRILSNGPNSPEVLGD